MSQHRWQELPHSVRDAIAHQAGEVHHVQPTESGSVAAFAATLTTDTGTYFCKGVITEDGPALRSVRTEARLNEALPAEIVPRLRWTIDDAGWTVLGFDHAAGWHPDLSVDSPDLPAVAATLTTLTQVLTPCPPVTVQPATARWKGWLDPHTVDGNTLAHTDVTPKNFLIGVDRRVQVVDWSMPVRGAAWIDTARMIIRLIRAGHTPRKAEAWAATIPAYAIAAPDAIDAFAHGTANLAEQQRKRSHAEHVSQLAEAATAWARHRWAR